MSLRSHGWLATFGTLAILPLIELVLPPSLAVSPLLRPVFIFALLAIGLNVVTGYAGLLNLGVAGFMAIGAYTYSILTCELFPFQAGFWLGILGAVIGGAVTGALIGIPTLRLRGDYLAVITLGFGEIVQDSLRNLDVITKGTQGINPVPYPYVFGYEFAPDRPLPWYYLFLALSAFGVWICRNVEHSRIGRAWKSIRDDEIASTCLGVKSARTKLLAFMVGAGYAALAGALWASYLGSSGEPGNYDFQISVIALCIVIIGGLGSLRGVLLGAFVIIGLNSIVLAKLSEALARAGFIDTTSVWSTPNNWKYFLFGIVLVLMMRYRPDGLLPVRHEASK